jgi:hypothetical protein
MAIKKDAVVLVLAIVTGGWSLGGCLDNDRSLVIMWAQPPLESECSIPIQGVAGAEYRTMGLLDLSFFTEPTYMMIIQAHNYLVNNTDEEINEVNSRDIFLERVEIGYRWLRNRDLIASSYPGLLEIENEKRKIPISGTLGAAAGMDDPGQLVMSIPEAIPPSTGVQLADLSEQDAELVVFGIKVKLVGSTRGGSKIESNTFLFPVELCFGCHACPGGGTYTSCIPGQDYFECGSDGP